MDPRRLAQRLPYEPTHPSRLPRRWRGVPAAAYAAIALVLMIVVVQFETVTLRNQRKAADPAYAARTSDPDKVHKGAIGRWRRGIHQFWEGRNVYLTFEQYDAMPRDERRGSVLLHPNSPGVVVLLTPFAYLPVWAMALAWSLAKLAVLVPTVLAAIRLANHGGRRMPDWVAFAGVVLAMDFFIADFQHGNTNVFVAAAVVGHLWLFRRGRDGASGLLLAVGVAMKMTPALFLLYWLYQRQWKVVAGLVAGLALLMVVLPAVTMGPQRAMDATQAWWDGLIRPGLVKGAWYPVHVNQSLPGMVARLFIGQPDPAGDIMWNPDDTAGNDPATAQWIAVWDLGPAGAKWLLRGLQVAIVLAGAWAIGWRRLPRDDGRRALHYGIVLAMMLLLNQRSWDHHATYLVVAHLAMAYAVFRGNLARRWRLAAGATLLVSWLGVFALSGSVAEAIGGRGADDVIEAWGRAFWHFLAVYALCVTLAVRLRGTEEPYNDGHLRAPKAARPRLRRPEPTGV